MKRRKFDYLIKEIARIYFVALNRLKAERFSDGEIDQYSPFYIFYHDVEEAFNHLNKINKRIINNEYFYQDYNGWWKKEYKESTFIRMKYSAVKAFVEAFYEIH